VQNTSVKITTARYYTPSGRSIQAKGIVPDVMLDETAEGNVFASLRTREADLEKHLNSGQAEVKDEAREKLRELERKRLEEQLAKKAEPPKPLPEFGSTEDFQLAQALNQLRLAGVDGPYCVVLGAEAYTALQESSDEGYPILAHIKRLIDSDIVWAPAIDGAVVLSTRGGDYELHLGEDLSIGYQSHDAGSVQLYFHETLTFFAYTAEASVALTSG